MLSKLNYLLPAIIFTTASCNKNNDEENQKQAMPIKTLADYEQSHSNQVFSIKGGDVPWGDYGRILVHGMTGHLGRNTKGIIQLERTAPFVPPITFPSTDDIIVTTKMKDAMEAAGFRGVSFRPVHKIHIVEVSWHTWDIEAEDADYYPEEGEPEGYILDKQHSPEMAKKIGELWEVVCGDRGDLHGRRNVSARAKLWFQDNYPRWTSFRISKNQ